jgi:integrase
MKEVDAIKNREDILKVGDLLEKHYSTQLKHLWAFGVNVALRISDLLSIELRDITKANGCYRLRLKEGKTGKRANIKLNENAVAIYKEIKASNPDSIYLFQSVGSKAVKAVKPLGRSFVSAAFKEVGDMLELHIGTHSMRKTRGFHLYKVSNDIGKVMTLLRHNSEAATLRYIGITQESIDQDFDDLLL